MCIWDESQPRWTETEDDELVRRLRRLEWPQVSAEVRERCWEEFSRALAEQRDADLSLPEATDRRERSRHDAGQRFDYSRRGLGRGLLPLQRSSHVVRAAASRPWARPARALALT